MTTFDQVIDDLYRTEEPVYCIFSNLGTKRCLVEISREQLESTPPLLSLVTESDYDIQRLDGQFFSRLLCTEHQNMDVIQGIIQNWLWDQDAMRLSMPGNETPMDSSSLNNPVSVEVSAPSTPRSLLGSQASNHTTLSTPDSRISPSATNNIQDDFSAHHTVGGRQSASRAPSSSQSRRRTRESPDASSLQESPTTARIRRRNVRNETQRTASAPEIPTSQSGIAERPQAPSRIALSDQVLPSSGTNLNRQTPRTPLVQNLSIDSIPELMPGSFGPENTGNEEAPPSVQADVESGDDAEAMSIDSVGEITPPASNIETPSSANRRSIYTTSRIQDAHSIDGALRMKIKEDLPKKDKQKGYVYIFRDPARPNLLKIGKTDLEVSKRRENIERRCRITLETVYQEGEGMDLLPLRNCQRAEQLVHKELANYNRRHLCPTCKERHKEWFAVSEDLAKKTIQRWVTFIRKQPYDENGVLHDFWQERLYCMERPNLNEKPEDHDIRHERWKFVITATYFHFWKHWAWKTIFAAPERDRPRESLYFKLVRFRWQLFAELSWVIIAVLSFPSVIASSIFVVMTCFVFFDFLRE
jgi:T5orf172 domain